MKTAFIFISFAFLVLSSFSATNVSEIRLIENGKSNYCIITGPTATHNDLVAANILQRYIFKISDVELPIYSDNNPKAKSPAFILSSFPDGYCTEPAQILKEDGYCIQSSDNNIYITGGSGMGVIYGVTGFLEDYLGVRILAPGEEFIPKRKNIILGAINDIQIPPATIRVINGPFANDTTYKYFRKLNTISDRWHEPGYNGYYVHTFNRLVPPDEYFDEHPEYFALINNKWVPYGQLCLSNPDVLKIVINKLRKEMEAHPAIKYWSVSQNDDFEYCRCDKCRAIDSLEGSPSGLMLRFVNAVAKEFPDKVITSLAYQYTRKPPLITMPDSNVMVTLCSIELNRTHPIPDDPAAASFRSDMEGWGKICNNIMMWDYEVQFTNFLTPFPLFNTLQPNLQYFTKNNVIANFQQCNASHGVEFAELKAFLLSKLLWNPDIDVNAVINDFMFHYYGNAGVWVRKYFDLLHAECLRYNQYLDIYGNPVQAAQTYLSAENMEIYKAYFDSAEYAVKNDSLLLARVKNSRLPIMYSEIEIAKSDLFGPRGWFENINGNWVKKESLNNLFDDFITICVENNMTHLNETPLLLKTWQQNTLRNISMNTANNKAFKKTVYCMPEPDPKYKANGNATLTNGVRGTEDYKINWLGWEACDVEIILDLGSVMSVDTIEISTLQFPKSWILHPLGISCSVSNNNKKYKNANTVLSDINLQNEPMMKSFVFLMNNKKARYIKFDINATKYLPEWHNYNGLKSWVFVDEIIVK